MTEPLDPRDLIGQQVIVDTNGAFLCVGTLAAVGPSWLVLTDCDLHDHRESSCTREVYVMEAVKYGVRANRKRTLVRLDDVVAISRFADIVIY